MIPVRRSRRMDHAVFSVPDSIQSRMWTMWVSPSCPRNTIHDKRQDRNNRPVATHCAPMSPMIRQPNPAMMAPMRGAKRMVNSIGSAFHHVDVFHGDGAAVAEEADKNGQPDRRLGRSDRQDEQGKDLSNQIAQKGRKRDKVDVDREQHQFNRHQQDDDVLPVQEEAENPDDEQRRRHRQVMFKSNHACPSGLCPSVFSFVSSRDFYPRSRSSGAALETSRRQVAGL